MDHRRCTAVLFLYGFSNGQQTQREPDAIESENRTFCEKHGMPLGTQERTSCVEDLADIRVNEHQRTLNESGIF